MYSLSNHSTCRFFQYHSLMPSNNNARSLSMRNSKRVGARRRAIKSSQQRCGVKGSDTSALNFTCMYLIDVVGEELQSNPAHDATNPGRWNSRRRNRNLKAWSCLVAATALGSIQQVGGFYLRTCRLLSVHWLVGRDAINGRASCMTDSSWHLERRMQLDHKRGDWTWSKWQVLR